MSPKQTKANNELKKKVIPSSLDDKSVFNVLVFDDNPMDYELIQLYLRNDKQFQLSYVSNFELFKVKIVDTEIDVIICDFDLGSVTALDVFEFLKFKKFNIPFIVVSGAQGEERAVEILKTGVTDYVLKDKCDKLPFVLTRALKEHEKYVHEQYILDRLKESENKLREIFNSIIDVYFESGLDGIERVISPSVLTVLGYTPEEIIGGKATDLYVNPEERSLLLQSLLNNGMVKDFEISLIAKDRTIRTISANAQLMLDENNQPIGIKGVYRDISDKKKQESILIQREAQLRESQKMANLGSWEIDSETKKIRLSDEFFLIFELPPDKIERKNFYEFSPLIHPDDRSRLEANMLKFIKTGNELPYEFRIITPNGKLKFISTKVFKVNRGKSGNFISGIIQDITDLKLLEEEKNNVQRQALEMLEEMVEQRTKKIEEQRTVIEQKNRDITDSIKYAKQVQMAILPSKESIDAFLPQNFVLYLPKDIVAGDFYWSFHDGQQYFIAAADCTGHGVPGALVSVICFNALNRAVSEYGLREPGQILNKTNQIVLDFFSQGLSEIKDGMDISLIAIDFEKKRINWSGANNPLVYFNGSDLTKVQPDKIAIGNRDIGKGFTTHIIPYLSKSSYYLFTDGFADQFGGKNDKKFMQKRFMALMELANAKPILKQEELFNNAFFDWKGDNEQIDDVAVIGFKLP
ncbi:MAG: PAS domain-containing protein [Bacteroidetes bacterium]|nr:PAS domain-containing protein [Bacteroidota bacterium]